MDDCFRKRVDLHSQQHRSPPSPASLSNRARFHLLPYRQVPKQSQSRFTVPSQTIFLCFRTNTQKLPFRSYRAALRGALRGRLAGQIGDVLHEPAQNRAALLVREPTQKAVAQQPRQRRPLLRRLLQHHLHPAVKRVRGRVGGGSVRGEKRGIPLAGPNDRLHRLVLRVRGKALEQLHRRDAQRPDVRLAMSRPDRANGGIVIRATHDLGSHPAGSPDERARVRLLHCSLHNARNAEISETHGAVGIN